MEYHTAYSKKLVLELRFRLQYCLRDASNFLMAAEIENGRCVPSFQMRQESSNIGVQLPTD